MKLDSERFLQIFCEKYFAKNEEENYSQQWICRKLKFFSHEIILQKI